MIKAVIFDFDGTLVKKDMLTLACSLMGKEKESIELNEAFMNDPSLGIKPLIKRYGFLKGLEINRLHDALKDDYLVSGAKELCAYLNDNKIISIIASPNLEPTLHYFQKLLKITHVIGIRPEIRDGRIVEVREDDIFGAEHKRDASIRLLSNYNIKSEESIAIGDSPADIAVFEYAGHSIAINARNGIEKYADYVINDLSEAIPIISNLNN